MPAHLQKPEALPGWMTLRAAFALVAVVTLARAVFLVWLSPYELTGDEAQYWDWSRRLDLSYYSKGPGVAWLIGASTRLFGHSEWAVRLPAAISLGVAALAVALLAHSISARARGVAFLACAAFLLVPAYQAFALFMTIDPPLIACWALAAWGAWSVASRAEQGRPTLHLWLATAAALGAGFLFKYTAILLLPGLALAALNARRAAPPDARTALRAALAAVLFAAIVSPVFVWNARHGWPTVAHLLGHLRAPGGDVRVDPGSREWSPLWMPEFIGAQAAMIGPLIGLMVLAAVRLWRSERSVRFCVLAAAPIFAFYLLVSLVSSTQANWAVAGYTTLIPPVALLLARELPRRRAMLDEWRAIPTRPRPRRGLLRRAPETPAQILWHWSIGYGLAGAAAVLLAVPLARAPLVGALVPVHRFTGHREAALAASDAARELGEQTGAEPLYIAAHYMNAALTAFYAPGHPRACSATSLLGGRESSYDYFPDTDLRAPAAIGRPAVLIGLSADRWERDLVLDPVVLFREREGRRSAIFTTHGYRGPRARGPLDAPNP